MIDAPCELPQLPPDSCCETRSVVGPVVTFNPPGQSRISYRIGNFGSFRQAMLADLAEFLPAWRPTTKGGDYATALIELWAYVADVLTFYEEQFANEAFIGTARNRESLVRLSRLIDYRPAPGAAASGLVSFAVAKGKEVTVPAGFQVASRAARGKPAAKFETGIAIDARGEHSSMPLAPMGMVNQFMPLDVLAGGEDPTLLAGSVLKRRVFGTLFFEFALLAAFRYGAHKVQPHDQTGTLPAGPATRTVWFAGIGLKAAVGDYLLIFDANDQRLLRRIVDTVEDRTSRRTAITFVEDPTHRYFDPSTPRDPVVYAMRVKASVFGANAPLWSTLSPYLRFDSVAGYPNPKPPFQSDWDDPEGPAMVDGANSVWLDHVYPGIPTASDEEKSWAVLMDGNTYQVLGITGVIDAGHSDFTLTARATRVDFDVKVATDTFSVRGTEVLVKSERLTLDNHRPLPELLTGSELILEGIYPNLVSGQRVIVTGKTWDAEKRAASDQVAAEDVLVDSVDAKTVPGTTVVELRAPLTQPSGYARSTTKVLGNVTPISHGLTVKEEILGNGDGSPWQQFALRKQPLTYLQSGGGDSPVTSTLHVNVNGVLWSEVPDLTTASRGARVFTVTQDDAERSVVEMGDGITGAAPPTGRDNVKASYRFGQGSAGNVEPNAVSQLVGGIPGLQAVTNPEPTTGGADREVPDQIRINAPASVRTFGRAISAADYSVMALSYPGVKRAKAKWVAIDPATGNRVSRPYIFLGIQTTSGISASSGDYAQRLRAFLDASRDTNVRLDIHDGTPTRVILTASIDVQPDHGRKATLAAAINAMSSTVNPDGSLGFFATKGFGDAVFLSAVYAALQAVPGVADVVVNVLRRPDFQSADLYDVVPISDEEIPNGQVAIVLGEGGFED